MEEMLVDVDSALELMGGDTEFLKELLTELVEQIDEQVPMLEQAVVNSDFENIRKIAHGLKGAAANLSAKRLAAYFSKLEKMGAAQVLDGSQSLIQNVGVTKMELSQFVGTL